MIVIMNNRKRIIKTIGVLTLTILLFPSLLPVPKGNKCSGEEEYSKGLNKMGDFRLIKDYRVSLKKNNKSTFAISLTKGLKYKFYPINHPDNDSKMIMTIYMKPGEVMKLASTQSSSLTHYPSIEFECGKSGKYYLVIHFEGNQKGCGVGMFTVSK